MTKNQLIIPIIGTFVIGGIMFQESNSIPKEKSNALAKESIVSNELIGDTVIKQNKYPKISNPVADVVSLPSEIIAESIQTEPHAFDHLTQGEELTIFIPQEQQGFNGTVKTYHQQFGGKVNVSSGSIENGNDFSSFTVTKGPELTLIMLATGENIYQIEINNVTGEGTVINDKSLDYFRKHDDGEMTPPEGIS